MSTASGIPGGGPDKGGEVHTETPQPIDLAHGHGHALPHPLHAHATHVLRANSPGATSVVQIRPMRTILTPGASLVGGKSSTVGLPTVVTATHPSILVNRGGGPLTLFQRGGQLGGVTSPNLSALQFTRGTILGNVRPSLSPGGQPTSITMTPLSAANFGGTSIRISSPVNNGSWIQTTGPPGTTYTSVRPTIQVTSRPIRPEGGKIIHIPQGGGVQHLTQLQVVDNKGSIIKPTTPISVRGTLQQPTGGGGITLGPLAPFTIRATPIQRPPPSVITTAPQAQKVITQPAHGPPIIVNANQKFTQIQNFSSLQRTPVISIAANGGTSVITGTNPTLVSMSPRPSSSIIMSSSGGTPTKAYPISSRDISTTLVETYINQGHVQPQQNHINSPTLTVVPNVSHIGQHAPPSGIRPTFVITSSSNPTSLKGITPPSHQIVQVQPPINTGGLNLSNYYIEPKNLATNVSIYPALPHGKRISIHETSSGGEKRNEKGGLVTSGQMILTSSGQIPDGGGGLAAHFAHPIPLQTTPSSNQITAHPLSLPKGSSLSSIPHSHISIHPHSIPTNVISPAIITTSVTTTTSSANTLTTTNTSIVTLSLNSFGGNGNGGGGAAISTITTTSSTTVSPPVSISTTTPSAAQSPSQSKSTLSPRPSILRKREAGACETNFVPLRAQRNLSVNFTSGGTLPLGLGNNGPTSTTSSPSVLISTVSNKENNSTNLGGFVNSLGSFGLNSVTPSSSSSGSLGGVSILKKEFQPPNEESSWQSSSSTSSSGSTTISATSETAELPGMDVGFVAYHQPPPLPTPVSSIGHHHNPTNLSGIVITRTQPQPTSFPLINVNPVQNGVLVRGRAPPPSAFAGLPSSVAIVSGHHPIAPRHRAALTRGRELKGRGKDVVSPRKKPRKQLLTSSDFIESSSQEISFYPTKRFKRNEAGVGKSDKGTEQGITAPVPAPPPQPPEPQEERILYLLKKPHASLFETNKFVPNLLHNHFKRYSDVKSKDERRPTISDLANQKNVLVKISGWKLKHLTTQMERVVDSEVEVVQQFNSLLSELNSDDFVTSASSSRDLSRIEDLLKGNLQRCKVVKDQLTESKSQVSKVLEHHPRILDVISKHISKRPAKKREKV